MAAFLSILIPIPAFSCSNSRTVAVQASATSTVRPVQAGISEAEALYERAKLLAQTGRYRPSLISLFEAVRLWKGARQPQSSINALQEMAALHMKADRWQDALDCYRLLLNFEPLTARLRSIALNSVALIYARFRRGDLAKGYYRRALDTVKSLRGSGDRAAAFTELAAVCGELGEGNQAIVHLEQARRAEPDEANPREGAERLRLAGQVYQEQGRIGEARRAFEQALEIGRAHV